MTTDLEQARDHFIQGMSQISHFWGFPKAMGAIYGAIYLSPTPMTLDELVAQVGVSKGTVSTNVRKLERLQMVHKQVRVGDRKDYYVAETDLWKIVRGVLQERQNRDFSRALQSVDESLSMVSAASATDADLAHFYQERIANLQAFFKTLDKLVATIAALDQIRLSHALGVQKLFKRSDKTETEV
jgi:DNA-binding transcriptional regulator GbsR (MarR family)